ncbi:DEAD/DEAH box helicase [Hyphomonas pacifica]|uniref:DEAD/DEAH box helicase n=1 Tax=Hyphomonas pacifica TaxID=1280941 RepID=UPI000DBF7B0C|nr:DEAD/DEAH box helicase family protein [Hyphomonas pacifica]RAN37414.1 hypothetical protein HY11_09050 [Hyphomonas pacifica]
MNSSVFQTNRAHISGNPKLREPQIQTYEALSAFAEDQARKDREAGIVLPVGCGKSGCITLAPFAFKARRALVVAPGLNIARQLAADFDPASQDMFYKKCGVLSAPPFPEPVEIRGNSTNLADLEEAEVVITNIQQLQGADNRWLERLPDDFFDLILFDEGHHSVAESWQTLKIKFPHAHIVNFSATPQRADGQLMAGNIIYSFPVGKAIQLGFVKRLKAVRLNPKSLRYVRREDDTEIEVDLEEVRRLGESDAGFRRSIVTSKETLDTIVDASIRQLQIIRNKTSDNRLKIIASALNYEHCIQVVEAYRARGFVAEYVHSREESAANDRVLANLDNHELDVIVQVRKLGEGFDHPYLSVAAVFSIFSNLSPFVQFVGRIMRVIKQGAPNHILNQGIVVFHSGANVARRWEDFQVYSEADQDYFDQLLSIEELDFDSADELETEPIIREYGAKDGYIVKKQTGVEMEEIDLLSDDPEIMAALNTLRERGLTPDQVKKFMELEPVQTTKVRERQARRSKLDDLIKIRATKMLKSHNLRHEARDLDLQRLGRTNFIVVKSAIDKSVNSAVGRSANERHEFTRADLDFIDQELDNILEKVEAEIFHGKS